MFMNQLLLGKIKSKLKSIKMTKIIEINFFAILNSPNYNCNCLKAPHLISLTTDKFKLFCLLSVN